MNFLKRLFKRKQIIYQYKILEYDDDIIVRIIGEGGINYMLDLDWEDGVMDIEFSVIDSLFHDTTNLNVQYKLLNTISHITKEIISKHDMLFHTVAFKSSKWRGGVLDEESGDIRNRFFSRYVFREHPNATVENGEYGSVIIKLNNV